MAKGTARAKNGESAQKRRSSPPMEPAQKIVKSDSAAEDSKIVDAVMNTDLMPTQEIEKDPNKWTPCSRLEDAVKAYFEALSDVTGKLHQTKMLANPEPARREYRNLYMIGKIATNQNAKWLRRLENAKERNNALKATCAAMRGAIAKIHAKAMNTFGELQKLSVDDAAQQHVIDLVNTRFEELYLDACLVEESADFIFKECVEVNDPEFDASFSSIGDIAMYADLPEESAIAALCLKEFVTMMEEDKKNQEELAELQKRSLELDMQLAAADRRLEDSRRKVGGFGPVLEEVFASEAWQKKHDLL